MIIARTISVPDSQARDQVFALLAGRGAPAGITSCVNDGSCVTVVFDSERTSADLLDALLAVATTFVPARVSAIADVAEATAIAARGLDEPALDVSRIIESYLA